MTQPNMVKVVPCGTCTACCRSFPAIFLHPEHGDDPAQYETVMEVHPLSGQKVPMLKHKANGDCVYLLEGKCSIYDKRPVICQEYDCRVNYLMWTKKRRKALVVSEIWQEAKKRLHTLTGAQRLAAIAKRNRK